MSGPGEHPRVGSELPVLSVYDSNLAVPLARMPEEPGGITPHAGDLLGGLPAIGVLTLIAIKQCASYYSYPSSFFPLF